MKTIIKLNGHRKVEGETFADAVNALDQRVRQRASSLLSGYVPGKTPYYLRVEHTPQDYVEIQSEKYIRNNELLNLETGYCPK